MSNKKDINARIVHKHDLEKNWDNASNFIPKQGELIIYDREFSIDDLPLTRSELITYERMKVGDGSTLVKDLPFVTEAITESDPTVPAWAKAATKPSYTANEVGALPLAGGTMTGEIKIGQGDGKGIQLGTNGRINATVGTNTSATMFGVSNGNYYLGHSGFKTLMRGSTTRPTYNNDDLALYSDISAATKDALAAAKESGDFDGADGYTPVRGTDYWTDVDKAEIKSYVDDAILNGEW